MKVDDIGNSQEFVSSMLGFFHILVFPLLG